MSAATSGHPSWVGAQGEQGTVRSSCCPLIVHTSTAYALSESITAWNC